MSTTRSPVDARDLDTDDQCALADVCGQDAIFQDRVTFRKGPHGDRYNVEVDGHYIGWVYKIGGKWNARLSNRHASHAGFDRSTRKEAVEDLMFRAQRNRWK